MASIKMIVSIFLAVAVLILIFFVPLTGPPVYDGINLFGWIAAIVVVLFILWKIFRWT
jgi:hypothetical protein